MYTQEAIDDNHINTRNKYYRAMVDYKFNKLVNTDTSNIASVLRNTNLTKKDLYYITMAIDDYKYKIMKEQTSCIDSNLVEFDHKKLTLNIIDKEDTDLEDIIYTLREDVVETIQEAIVNLNANTLSTDHAIKEDMRSVPFKHPSINITLSNSIEVINLMSNISIGFAILNSIKKDSYRLSCIERILHGRMTRHNALFLLETFKDDDSVWYYIEKVRDAIMASPNTIESVNRETRSIKFKKYYSIECIVDSVIRVMSRVFDIIKLDLESVNYALTLFKEENKDTYGLPEDAVEFLDYFYRGIKAGYLPYKMISLDGNIGANYLLNLNYIRDIDNPSIDDYKDQLNKLTYSNIVDNIIRYHEDRVR